ncbi:tryptophanyl-tRNA synthetase [Colletotrichum melonis]|uniref:Tryptophan--tRNA ligase, cytoplasmic n=1 Tax=Colletotrichum melonis TaxID=1209925 RepID=A0AAI9TWB4_9PEZI|nr:tryptophanyl-tRNA synthetase [Colletotrichum melonis]
MAHDSNSMDESLSSLGDRICQHFVQSRFDERSPPFLPDGCIESLITEGAISNELFDEDDDPQTPEKALIRFVKEKAKKIFAITVCSGITGSELLKTVRFFRIAGFNDSHLPIEKAVTPGQYSSAWVFPFPFDRMAEKRIKRIWNGWRINNFYTQQWAFLAPVFSKTEFQHYLSPDCIFPFTWVNNIVKGGMFSQVYEVEIHPKHQEQPELTVDDHPAHVAIKEILVNNNLRHEIEKNYEDERKALSEITDLRHNHIIKRIAAITRGDKRYFMFQWADGGNLREFWKEQNRPTLTPDLVKQTITQLCGLADALHALHNYKDQGNYRHGDLKPENILRFRDSTCVGVLKIADMGLAKHHNDATAVRKKATSAKYGTVRYEPPEVVTNRLDKARSRLYDIWSMGCIMLECVIWLLYGYEALDNFDDSLNDGYDSSFFKTKDVDGARVAEVHPTVVKWMDLMAADPQCSRDSALGDLLGLVRNRLLVVPLRIQAPTIILNGTDEIPIIEENLERFVSVTSTSQNTPDIGEIGPYRADARAMRSGLERILRKADSNQTYLLRSNDRQTSHGPALVPPRSQSNSLLSPIAAETPRGSNLFPGTLQAQRFHDAPFLRYFLSLIANMVPKLRHDHWRFSRDNGFAKMLITKTNNIANDLSLPRSQKLCQHCERLDILATGFHLSDTVSDLQHRAGACGFCNLLLEACQKLRKAGSFQLNREGSTLRMSGITDPILSIVHDPDSTFSKYDSIGLQIGFPRLAPRGHPLHFEVLRQWLQSCDQDSSHSNCLQAGEVNLPTRLLDVSGSQIRLWETNGARGKYLALSHPWGDPAKHRHFCTYMSNIEKHRRGIGFEDLPATFKDAIITTRELGFQHLWIDSICIVQGPDGDFKEESKHMEDVFSFAYCVIAASRATGQEDGFLGPRPDRNYVTFSRNSSGKYHVCQQIDDFEGDVLEGRLCKRGWVLQERALAHRTIYFTERQTYWECGQGVRCETMTKLDNNVAAFLGDPRFPTIAMNSPRGAKIHLYQDLYKQYSRLQFSRNEDRPFGIAGLEKRLIQSFKTHGGYGVIDDGGGLLRRSLLWQRGSDSTLDRIIFPAERDLEVPTWSWMAYKGGIDYLEPPFDGVDWEKSEIQSPWANKSPDGFYHTSDKSLGISLSAVAREFSQLDAGHSASKLIFDNPAKSDGQLPNDPGFFFFSSIDAPHHRPRPRDTMASAPEAPTAAIPAEAVGDAPAASGGQKVDPWNVSGEVGTDGKVKAIDYKKIVDEFGTKLIDDALLERFERVTGHRPHHFLRRQIVFSHRDLDLILDRVEKKQPFFIYTGRGPSSDSMHVGHAIPFQLTKWLSDVLDAPLVIMMTDDEKFLFSEKRTVEEVQHYTRENAKDIIAIGFNPERTFIFSDYDYMGGNFYKNVTRVAKRITLNTAKAVFGFDDSSNIGKVHFASIQASSSFGNSFPHIFGDDEAKTSQIPCLIPCAIDQDPYFRVTRDCAAGLRYAKPSLIHSRFLDALQGPGSKMSASIDSSAIFLNDTPKQIQNKMNKYAFSGGKVTAEEQRAEGADPDVDVSYQYLRFFLDDDEELAKIREDYRTGKMLTGEIKKRCAEELAKYCTAFQERRAKVDEETVNLFFSRRPLSWGLAENLKSIPIREANTDGPAEGADGKMTKNQLKKLEKQRQIDEKKAAKAKEKEAAKASA